MFFFDILCNIKDLAAQGIKDLAAQGVHSPFEKKIFKIFPQIFIKYF